MASIARDNMLPPPATVTVRGAPVRRSSAAGSLLFSSTPDAQLVPIVIDLAYVNAPGPVLDALRRHYREHGRETFLFTIPRTSEVVSVRYLTPPAFQWGSAVAGSATVELEVQLAHQ